LGRAKVECWGETRKYTRGTPKESKARLGGDDRNDCVWREASPKQSSKSGEFGGGGRKNNNEGEKSPVEGRSK